MLTYWFEAENPRKITKHYRPNPLFAAFLHTSTTPNKETPC